MQQLYISNPYREQSVEEYSKLHPNTGWRFRRADWFSSCRHARKWGEHWHQYCEMRDVTPEPERLCMAML